LPDLHNPAVCEGREQTSKDNKKPPNRVYRIGGEVAGTAPIGKYLRLKPSHL